MVFRPLPDHPSATSNIIIMTNPAAKPIVPKFECSPWDDSGINSSTTTKIIAPAAKDNKYGSAGINFDANKIIKKAPIGSTTPDNTPYKKAFHFPIPDPIKGMEMIAPSGKF